MGWAKHPGADPGGRELPGGELSAADRAAPVLGVGAYCELDARGSVAAAQAFRISEFVRLANGRQVTLHAERGVTIGAGGADVRDELTEDHVVSAVLGAVLPDDDTGELHPWPWLAELARDRGLDVTAEQLAALRYEVVLGEDVRRWLGASG